jgi:superfamily II DNA helicase RecQ
MVILSPEMLQSRRFVERVLRKTEFASRCLSVFVDEAHCVSHWGADFRKKYGSLGMVRSFLPTGTSMVAVSATFTPRVRRDVLQRLQYGREFFYIHLGNDRTTVPQAVRAMEHPMNTFHDIDFLIPSGMQCPEDIPKGFVYYDDVNGGSDMESHLNGLVKVEFRHLGLVRPYNAAMSQRYRNDVMRLFKAGIVRILICTDAAGMVRGVFLFQNGTSHWYSYVRRAVTSQTLTL